MAEATKAKDTEKTDVEKVDDLIEAINVPIMREQRIAAGPDSLYGGFEKTYKQKKLAFFNKLEFTKVISSAIKKAIAAGGTEDGESININGIIEGVTSTSAEAFVNAILELAEQAPGVMQDVYCLALGVPEHEREIVKSILREAEEEDGSGGMNDEDGIAVLEVFVLQNARSLRDFSQKELPKIFKMAQRVLGSDDAPTQAQSKPSKRSARSTR